MVCFAMQEFQATLAGMQEVLASLATRTYPPSQTLLGLACKWVIMILCANIIYSCNSIAYTM